MDLTPLELQKAFEEAQRLAEKAFAEDEVPVGALILKRNEKNQLKVIAKAHNQKEGKNDPLSHAECEVIRKAAKKLKSWRLENCVLVVTLEPCPLCLAACQQARLSSVYYGAHDFKGGSVSLGYHLNKDLKLNHRFEVIHYDYPEAGKILSKFFKSKRNKAPK